jgi:hypothetical protein
MYKVHHYPTTLIGNIFICSLAVKAKRKGFCVLSGKKSNEVIQICAELLTHYPKQICDGELENLHDCN